jgi:hypothetical protein
MNKTHYLLIFFLTFYLSAQAQSERETQVKYSVDLGGSNFFFQDVKYSSLVLREYGARFGFTYHRLSAKHYWNGRFYFLGAKGAYRNAEYPESRFAFQPDFNVAYQYRLNDEMSIGGGVSTDFLLRRHGGLGNNSTYLNSGLTVYVPFQYRKELNDDFTLTSEVRLGLLSVLKEGTSFAFSAPQTILEDGLFDYQTSGIDNPFAWKYAEIRPIGKFLNLEMIVAAHYKKRWTFFYEWSAQRFSTVKNYPTIYGAHTLGCSFNFVSKTKLPKNK